VATVVLLDTDCLIDLDEGSQPHAEDLARIVEVSRRGDLEVATAERLVISRAIAGVHIK
jgi:hypothetical protein